MSAKQKRQGKRMCVKREIDKVVPILEDESQFNELQLRQSLMKLTCYKDELHKADELVLADLTEQEGIETEILDSAEYNDKLLDVITRIQVMLEIASQKQNEAGASTDKPKKNSGNSNRTTLRLPKLELRPFTGEPLKWQSFWDSYETSVHHNSHLSEIDKFNYLRGLLSGDALKAIDGYRLTAANYSAVIDTLMERFGNKQTAIFAHFEAMLSIKEASHDTKELQSVSDQCEQHIRSLVALGLDESTFGQVFTPIMLSKLPKFVKMELHRRNASQNWELFHLREWLKDEIRAREMSERSFCGEIGDSKKRNGPDGKSNGRPKWFEKKPATSTSALVSSAGTRKVECAFCHEGHYSDECSKFSDIDARRSKLKNQCFCCLGKDHAAKSCRRKIPCVHCKKQGHHRSLCYAKFGRPKVPTGVSTQNIAESSTVSTVAVSNTSKRTILQTAIATVCNAEKQSAQARLLFDTAGSRTFITEQKRRELQLPFTGEELISIAGFQSRKRRTEKYKMVEFSVQCSDGSVIQVSASVVPTITCPIQKIPIGPEQYPVLRSVHLAEPLVTEPEFVGIDILIGLDYYYDFIMNERIQCPNGPLLLSSRLGYITTGRVPTTSTGPETIAVMFVDSNSQKQQIAIEKYWDLEDIGIKECPKQLNGDEEAMKHHNATLERDQEGRYISRWPWNCDKPDLSDNYDVAFGRLTSLLKRLKSNSSEIMDAYSKTIESQIEAGVVEEAPLTPTGPLVYYMPHHCVITPSKATTKLRIVYDASSKSRKDRQSLNECLHRGPILMEDLCSLLMRFRMNPVALVSDIEKAFLQIGLHTEERDVTRFLWVKNPSLPLKDSNLMAYRFCRVPFGIISSPFILENTVCHHLLNINTSVSLKILRDHYVDNVVTGEKDIKTAIEHYHEAKQIFSSARMNLREWYSNCADVQKQFADSDKGREDKPKILGLRWDCTKDTIRCEASSCLEYATTKREILKSIAKVFDPLGFFSPVTLVGKLLVQELWKAKYGWDEKLPADVIKSCSHIATSFDEISTCDIPRFIGTHDGATFELHVFTDASIKACGAAVYLRTISTSISCQLVASKTRLSPVKGHLTIPRLELVAVVIGVRLLKFVQRGMHLGELRMVLWTDSQCTLHWIKRQKMSTRFVENRLKEIRKHTDVTFQYVPSAENPADVASRGCDVFLLKSSSIWWKGPEWLSKEESEWPNIQRIEEIENNDEFALIETEKAHENVIDVSTSSSLKRLIRCTAYILRFASNVRKPVHQRILSHLTAAEIQNSSLFWIKATQNEYFSTLVNYEGRIWPKGIGHQLNLFKDSDGVLRCAGRIGNCSMDYDAKYPILLPKNSHFTYLVIQACHNDLLHAGVAQTLAQVRRKFWVIHGRSTVKGVLKRCKKCPRFDGGPFCAPDPPDLPSERVSEEPPFSNVGIDYLGPLLVRNPDKSTRKVWICLYTCMAIRAIHLDIVEDLSTAKFLLSLRRFIATYGNPRLIVSDNASQFRAADRSVKKLWKEIVNSEAVQGMSANCGIKWDFIVELAPWMGGFYERLVGVVKRSLRKSLHLTMATVDELQTVLCEIMAVINSRPLTYIDSDDGFDTLTPAHFLGRGNKCSMMNFSTHRNNDSEFVLRSSRSDVIINKWKRLQAIGDNFWKTWRLQYLLSLRERPHRDKQRNTSSSDPSVGSVVLIKDNTPRSCWKMGRISELHVSRDGKIRSATVALSNGKHLRRSIVMLYPLEVPMQTMNAVESEESGKINTPIHVAKVNRSLHRAAAEAARSQWKQQINYSQQNC